MKDSLDYINFGNWENRVHHDPKAISSLRKAPSTPPTSVDREAQTAIFEGKKGEVHAASLNACTCQSFTISGRGQLPCKHIYSLALALGLIDLEDCDPITMSSEAVAAIIFEKDQAKREKKIDALSPDKCREVLTRTLRMVHEKEGGDDDADVYVL